MSLHSPGLAFRAALSKENPLQIVGTINATVDVYEKNFATEFTLVAEKGTIRLSGTNLNQIDFWNVEGLEKPDLDFKLEHQYGQGHNALYR